MMGVLFLFVSVQADSIPVANHSFETPVVPFAEPYALPYAPSWIELDNDTDFSANTGVFLNVTGIANTDANQLAFLGSEEGNAFLQDLAATYQSGKSYKITVGVCISAQYPPPDPNALALSFYYDDPVSDPNCYFKTASQPPSNLTATALKDFSVYLPTVQADDAWAGEYIGIAIRATGPMGGYWDLDNVRVTEYPLVPNFTDDSIVNLADFAMMAFDWLFCDEPLTDVTGEGCVDEEDLLILTEYWLDNV
jgi:hypothetical protein